MDSQPRRSSSAFEYFLYAAILVETALAAVIYTVIFRSAELEHLSIYFAIFYVAFVIWSIAQLKRLRHTRPTQAPREDTRKVLGLTGTQLVILVVVFAMAVATFSWALRFAEPRA
jgi:hypothetical protein